MGDDENDRWYLEAFWRKMAYDRLGVPAANGRYVTTTTTNAPLFDPTRFPTLPDETPTKAEINEAIESIKKAAQ